MLAIGPQARDERGRMGIKANVRATGWNWQEKVAQPGRKVVPDERSTVAVRGGFVVEK